MKSLLRRWAAAGSPKSEQLRGTGSATRRSWIGRNVRRWRAHRGNAAKSSWFGEAPRRWVMSCRVSPTATRCWKLLRSSNSACNSSWPCCSSQPRLRRLPALPSNEESGWNGSQVRKLPTSTKRPLLVNWTFGPSASTKKCRAEKCHLTIRPVAGLQLHNSGGYSVRQSPGENVSPRRRECNGATQFIWSLKEQSAG